MSYVFRHLITFFNFIQNLRAMKILELRKRYMYSCKTSGVSWTCDKRSEAFFCPLVREPETRGGIDVLLGLVQFWSVSFSLFSLSLSLSLSFTFPISEREKNQSIFAVSLSLSPSRQCSGKWFLFSLSLPLPTRRKFCLRSNIRKMAKVHKEKKILLARVSVCLCLHTDMCSFCRTGQ